MLINIHGRIYSDPHDNLQTTLFWKETKAQLNKSAILLTHKKKLYLQVCVYARNSFGLHLGINI